MQEFLFFITNQRVAEVLSTPSARIVICFKSTTWLLNAKNRGLFRWHYVKCLTVSGLRNRGVRKWRQVIRRWTNHTHKASANRFCASLSLTIISLLGELSSSTIAQVMCLFDYSEHWCDQGLSPRPPGTPLSLLTNLRCFVSLSGPSGHAAPNVAASLLSLATTVS